MSFLHSSKDTTDERMRHRTPTAATYQGVIR